MKLPFNFGIQDYMSEWLWLRQPDSLRVAAPGPSPFWAAPLHRYRRLFVTGRRTIRTSIADSSEAAVTVDGAETTVKCNGLRNSWAATVNGTCCGFVKRKENSRAALLKTICSPRRTPAPATGDPCSSRTWPRITYSPIFGACFSSRLARRKVGGRSVLRDAVER